MNTFAFLLHPTSLHQVKNFWPLARILPNSFLKPFLKNQDFNVLTTKKIKSPLGSETQGFLIVCPLVPDDFEALIKLDEELVLDKIISASHLARRMGARIMGLGGHLGLLADKRPMIYKHTRLPVTCGSAFNAWTAFESVYKTLGIKNIVLKNTSVAVINPDNASGMLCARKFSESCAKLILCGGQKQRLDIIKCKVAETSAIPIEIKEELPEVLRSADIVINTQVGFDLGFNPADLKEDAIVCDISVFQHMAQQSAQRPDISVINCGMIRLPLGEKLGVSLDLPDQTVCASLAETMLLALEGKFVNYSLGENVNPDKLEEIADVAVRHGFEVSAAGETPSSKNHLL